MLAVGRLIGFVGFDVLREDVHWDEELIKLLRMVGFILASAEERKRSSEALALLHHSLELKIEQRTRELQLKHSQLLQSEKMASLGQLVAGVAHEINTPLGALKSNTDVLTRAFDKLGVLRGDTEMPEERCKAQAQRLLDVAEKANLTNTTAVQRIAKIVANLRQFARLDQAEVDTVDLHIGLESTLDLVRHEFKHRVGIERDYGTLPKVECYPNQLNQVFMNLLVNARQSIPDQGTVTVRTRLANEVELAMLEHHRTEAVVVEIADTGIGIAPAEQARIFDPGYTTKGVGVGTGLGLAIVVQIIQDHGGVIDLDSELGKGTSFRLILPTRLPAKRSSRAPTAD
jgi:two-component system NtrC family sensor kinase